MMNSKQSKWLDDAAPKADLGVSDVAAHVFLATGVGAYP